MRSASHPLRLTSCVLQKQRRNKMKENGEKYDEYIKAEDERLKREYPQYYEHPTFLDELAKDICRIQPLIQKDVAYACASASFSSCLPNLRIGTSFGALPMNELSIIIGLSGTSKTVPIKQARRIGTNLGLILPEKFTVEGIEEYFSERVGKTNRAYRNEPYGFMVIDELGQLFGEVKKKDYMAGVVEELSQFHDGHLKATRLVRGGRIPQDPIYVCVVGGTIPNTLSSLGKDFFTQGLAGRFNWCYIEPQKDIEIGRFRDYKRFGKIESAIFEKMRTLQKLLHFSLYGKDGNKRKDEVVIPISIKADEMCQKHFKECNNSWYDGYSNYPHGYNWQYLIRIPEMTLRQAGRNCIARNVDKIIEYEGVEFIEVSDTDFEKALERTKATHKTIQYLINYREQSLIHERKSYNPRDIYNFMNPYYQLMQAPKQMLNTQQLWKVTGIKDYNSFKKYLGQAVAVGKIEMVDKATITDLAERIRLKVDTKATIWKAN